MVAFFVQEQRSGWQRNRCPHLALASLVNTYPLEDASGVVDGARGEARYSYGGDHRGCVSLADTGYDGGRDHDSYPCGTQVCAYCKLPCVSFYRRGRHCPEGC